MALEIRKIGTEKEAEKKSRRNTLILSIVMIAILVFSTAGYFSLREDTGTNTGSGKVQNVGGLWHFDYNGNDIKLSSPPESAENISVLVLNKIENYAGKTVYVASEYDSGWYEINSALQNYAERVQPACFGECTKNLPEKDCNETMIVISRLNASVEQKGKVYEQDNCVFIEGNIDAVDAFIYQIFGIS